MDSNALSMAVIASRAHLKLWVVVILVAGLVDARAYAAGDTSPGLSATDFSEKIASARDTAIREAGDGSRLVAAERLEAEAAALPAQASAELLGYAAWFFRLDDQERAQRAADAALAIYSTGPNQGSGRQLAELVRAMLLDIANPSNASRDTFRRALEAFATSAEDPAAPQAVIWAELMLSMAQLAGKMELTDAVVPVEQAIAILRVNRLATAPRLARALALLGAERSHQRAWQPAAAAYREAIALLPEDSADRAVIGAALVNLLLNTSHCAFSEEDVRAAYHGLDRPGQMPVNEWIVALGNFGSMLAECQYLRDAKVIFVKARTGADLALSTGDPLRARARISLAGVVLTLEGAEAARAILDEAERIIARRPNEDWALGFQADLLNAEIAVKARDWPVALALFPRLIGERARREVGAEYRLDLYASWAVALSAAQAPEPALDAMRTGLVHYLLAGTTALPSRVSDVAFFLDGSWSRYAGGSPSFSRIPSSPREP